MTVTKNLYLTDSFTDLLRKKIFSTKYIHIFLHIAKCCDLGSKRDSYFNLYYKNSNSELPPTIGSSQPT